MTNITIKEIREKKVALIQELRGLVEPELTKFMSDTGVCIDNVHIKMVTYYSPIKNETVCAIQTMDVSLEEL